MSLSDGVLYFTEEMDSLDTPARPLSYVQHLMPARHLHTVTDFCTDFLSFFFFIFGYCITDYL